MAFRHLILRNALLPVAAAARARVPVTARLWFDNLYAYGILATTSSSSLSWY
jgi:hypothetical protein